MKYQAQTTAAAAAAAGLMIVLSACGPAAPGVAQPTGNPPTSNGSSSTSSSSSTTSAPSTSTDASTSSPYSYSPSASSVGDTCSASNSSIGPTPSSGTPSRGFGATANITTNNSDVKVGIKVEAPRSVSAGSFPSTPGTKLVAVKITATLLGGTSDYVGSTSFNMFDGKGNKCNKSYVNALPSDETWRGASLGSSTKSETGSLVYEVPTNVDTSSLVVAYNGQFRQVATVQWTG